MFQELIRDIGYVGHVELMTPKPQESLDFFRNLFGMEVVGQIGQSVYLRAWGEHQLYSLKLTESKEAGLGHLGLRAWSPEAAENRAKAISESGYGIGWTEGEFGHGKAYQFLTPDGHKAEIYYDSEKYVPPEQQKPKFKNQPQKIGSRGIPVKRLDHVNLFTSNVDADTDFWQRQIGFRLSECAVTEEGRKTTSWLHVTNKSYDLALSQDKSGAKGRFHHLAYAVETGDMVHRAADLFLDHGIYIETSPSKHVAGLTVFVYVYEPGGNRVEVCSGGFMIFDPDWETVVWTPQERTGLAWGNPLAPAFNTYGTPPVSK